MNPVYQRPESAVLGALSQGAAYHRQVSIRYRSFHGDTTERVIEPYGVVYYDGRWYAVGYCQLRQDVRSFRIDRVMAAELLAQSFVPPRDFDCVAYLEQTVPLAPGQWQIEAILHVSLDEARAFFPPMMAALEAVEQGVLFRCATQQLGWVAHYLLALNCPVDVLEPPELRHEFSRIAEHAARMAQSQPQQRDTP
jgi:predicted DNA-binding transcriptional regulator YafY